MAAFPETSPMIVDENVFAPAIVWSPDVITAPAASTLVASVTSAAVSMFDSLVRSSPVIMAPEPASVTSDNAVTLDVVYTPLVTVAALPDILPAIVFANVTAPPELIVIAFAVVVEPIVLPSAILMLAIVDTPCTANVFLIETADRSDVPVTYKPLLKDASFDTNNLLFIVTSFVVSNVSRIDTTPKFEEPTTCNPLFKDASDDNSNPPLIDKSSAIISE